MHKTFISITLISLWGILTVFEGLGLKFEFSFSFTTRQHGRRRRQSCVRVFQTGQNSNLTALKGNHDFGTKLNSHTLNMVATSWPQIIDNHGHYLQILNSDSSLNILYQISIRTL